MKTKKKKKLKKNKDGSNDNETISNIETTQMSIKGWVGKKCEIVIE